MIPKRKSERGITRLVIPIPKNEGNLKPFGVALDSYKSQARHTALLAEAMSELYSTQFTESQTPAQKRKRQDNLVELFDYHMTIKEFVKSNYAVPIVDENEQVNWVGPTEMLDLNDRKGKQTCYVGLDNKDYPDDLLPLPCDGWNKYIGHMQLITEKNLFL